CPDEKDQTRQEHPSPADDVSQPTAQHEKAAKGERIAADHPLDVLSRQTESTLHRGQCHVDDRDVQDQHELRRAKQREYQTRAMTGGADNQSFRWPLQVGELCRAGRDLNPRLHALTRCPDAADFSIAAMTSWRRTASPKSGTV